VIRRVAVTVPAVDEERRMARCLASITVAARVLAAAAGIPVRVIVALDGCRDQTAAICAAFPGVSTVTLASRNAGAARRAAAAAALAAGGRPSELWLASTDADSQVPPGWLTGMIAESRAGADLVLGTVLPGPDLSPAVRARWLARQHLHDGHPHVHGANLGIRGSAYTAIGGWQALASGEDADLARRAAAAGWAAISRTAAIPVVTSVRRDGRAPGGFSSYLRALGPAAAPVLAVPKPPAS
jgi:cellulose synthase/poly-beta-1,6-N-acetylglucosamine synthase-like glycosyltransferase